MEQKAATDGIDARDLRVELRRYLAGIPYSHRRDLTADERRQIKAQIRPYAFWGTVALIFSAGCAAGAFLSPSTLGAMWWFFSLLFFSIPACCAYWAWPFLQTLRRGTVDAFIGRMSPLANFDVAFDHYMKTTDLQAHLNRYVELLAIGDGERIWRIEGMGNDETLAGVRSVWCALVPDHDERGERPLTDEEKRELLIRAREFMRLMPFACAVVVTGLVTFVISAVLSEASFGSLSAAPLIFAPFFMATTLLVCQPLFRRWRFGRTILQDRQKGKVREGTLPSGLPWVVDGEPARWRVGRPKGGMNGLSPFDALQLEIWARESVPAAAPASPLPNQKFASGPRGAQPTVVVEASESPQESSIT